MLKRITSSPVLLSLLLIIMGIVLVVWPSPVISAVITLVGVGLMVGGVIAVIGWLRNRDTTVASYSRFGSGLLGIVAGIIITANPIKVASFFPVMIGVVILITGIINLVQSLDLRKMGYQRWVVPFILALVTILCGIAFITQPITALEIPVIAAGVMLIYDGLVSLWVCTRK